MTDPAPAAALRGAVDLSALRNRPAAPPAGAAAPAVPSLVFDVTDETFPQVLELSRTVPVVIDLWAEWCGPCKQLSPILEKVVTELAGRLVLAKVDVDANPQLSQAFRAQSIPMVVALVGGQPVPLFTGAVPEQQVREVFAQLLQLAAQNGVTGVVPVDGDAAPPRAPSPSSRRCLRCTPRRSPRSRRATTPAPSPRTRRPSPRTRATRTPGRASVRCVCSTACRTSTCRRRALRPPRPRSTSQAQFAVADLDVSGGHVDDAFDRLLDLFAALPSDERGPVRERLLELFGLVGDADPRVIGARGRLASLLF